MDGVDSKPPGRGCKEKVYLPTGNGTRAIQLLVSFNTLLKYIWFKLLPEKKKHFNRHEVQLKKLAVRFKLKRLLNRHV
jgi:hypothetical protein